MKIALFSTFDERCGIAENSKLLVDQLRKKGIEVQVFSEGKDWDRHKQFDKVARKINECGADILHADYEMFLCGFGGDSRFSSFLKRVKLPKVVELHNWVINSPPKDFEADVFLTRGSKMTDAAKEVFGDKVHKTTFGTEVFEDINKLNSQEPHPPYLTIATHGFLGADKGLDGIVDAFIQLNKSGVSTQLKFIGSLQPNSPHRTYMIQTLKKIVSNNLMDHAPVTGFLNTTREIQEAALGVDVLIFNYNDLMTQGVYVSTASVYRVLPVGVPIIGTLENRLEDLVHERVIYGIPQHDTNAMVNAILDFGEYNSKAKSLASKAREYSKGITWDRISEDTIKIYEGLI